MLDSFAEIGLVGVHASPFEAPPLVPVPVASEPVVDVLDVEVLLVAVDFFDLPFVADAVVVVEPAAVVFFDLPCVLDVVLVVPVVVFGPFGAAGDEVFLVFAPELEAAGADEGFTRFGAGLAVTVEAFVLGLGAACATAAASTVVAVSAVTTAIHLVRMIDLQTCVGGKGRAPGRRLVK